MHIKILLNTRWPKRYNITQVDIGMFYREHNFFLLRIINEKKVKGTITHLKKNVNPDRAQKSE